MSSNEITQIPRNLLFRYRFVAPRIESDPGKWFELPGECQLPALGLFEGQRKFADWRIAWNSNGLLYSVDVTGKNQSLWCRPAQLLESDGVHLWVDTRNTQNVHRATRYCHYFLALPVGGPNNQPALSTMVKINRSREDAPTLNRTKTNLQVRLVDGGYSIRWAIPAASLNGWSPKDVPEIGFYCAVVDRELGWQTLAAGPELPITEDPSLWHTLALDAALKAN